MGFQFLNHFDNATFGSPSEGRGRKKEPNVKFEDFKIVTRGKIEKGTELIIDYYGKFKEKEKKKPEKLDATILSAPLFL